jgi:hypothetical protein
VRYSSFLKHQTALSRKECGRMLNRLTCPDMLRDYCHPGIRGTMPLAEIDAHRKQYAKS